MDPLFIYTFKMGIRGAAVATIISQMLSLGIAFYFLCGNKTTLQLSWSNLKPDKAIIKSIVGLGVSPCIIQLTETLINISYNQSLQKYGGDIAIGAMTIASTVMQIFFLSSNGLGQAAQSIVSYNYGAKNVERFKRCVRIFIACLRKVILIFPLIYILPCFMEDKVFAVFLSQPVGDFISALIAGCILLYKYPQLIEKMEECN